MENYRATLTRDLKALRSSSRTLHDIFEISFAHAGMRAYERLVDLRLETATYGELRVEIESFASYLRSAFPPMEGEWIGIDLPNSPSFIIAFWGSLMAGYSPYLINSYYPLELRSRLLARLGIKKTITFSNDYRDQQRPDITGFPRGGKVDPAWWADRFAISSTLTGLEAKIAVYEGRAVAAEIENSEEIVRGNPWFMHDYHGAIKVAAILPFFHVFGLIVSYLWFSFYGRTIVFFKDLAPETVRSSIIRHEITHVFAPPLLFHKLQRGIEEGVKRAGEKKKRSFGKAVNFIAKVGDFAPRLSLRLSRFLLREVRREAFGDSPCFMISGGAYIDPVALKTINAIGYPLFNGYGTTEISITGANLARKFSSRIDGSIGAPFPSVSYTLEKDGTLLVRGTSLASKILYLDGREKEVTAFKTNDLVESHNGSYFIIGRKNDLFISENGENVSPDLIERQLALPLATRFSVLELHDKLTLVIEYRKGLSSSLIADELEKAKTLLGNIPYGQNVHDILLTYDPISNPNAIKVSREQLRRAIREGKVNLVAPSSLQTRKAKTNEGSTTLSLVEGLFLDSLGREAEIGPDSDYFLDLGGDSMGYISLLLSIERTFDVHLDLEREGSPRTPADFLKIIEGKQ